MAESIVYEPIGIARSPYMDKVDAPRQATTAAGVLGTIELFNKTGFAHALSDLEGFERLIVLFHFDRANHFSPKVQPPRSDVRRGLFATRAPHRPNAIGLSIVRLVRIEGLTIHVSDVDWLDGSPVLDIKPYIPYADSFPDARTGWLGRDVPVASTARAPRDPIDTYDVNFSCAAEEQEQWLSAQSISIREAVVQKLSLGPAPHAYRRIRRDGDTFVLAHKEWRVRFRDAGDRVIEVLEFFSGYRPKELHENVELHVHRAFSETFGAWTKSVSPSKP